MSEERPTSDEEHGLPLGPVLVGSRTGDEATSRSSLNSDAAWCGHLAQTLREIVGMIERGDHVYAAEYAGDTVREYEDYARAEGFDTYMHTKGT